MALRVGAAGLLRRSVLFSIDADLLPGRAGRRGVSARGATQPSGRKNATVIPDTWVGHGASNPNPGHLHTRHNHSPVIATLRVPHTRQAHAMH
eukprot:5832847-Prymnesium_polylepis.1